MHGRLLGAGRTGLLRPTDSYPLLYTFCFRFFLNFILCVVALATRECVHRGQEEEECQGRRTGFVFVSRQSRSVLKRIRVIGQ